MKLLFFDLETTGVNFWKHGIHQIAGCIEIDGELKENFNFSVAPHPSAKIEPEALQVGNVTEEQIRAYPSMQSVHQQFLKMLGRYVDKFNKKDKFFLVGYNNAGFDNQFLRAWFTQNNDQYFGSWFWSNTIDTFILATVMLMEKRADMVDFKLKTVAAALGIQVDESRLHDASYDIALTRAIYHYKPVTV